MADRKVSELPTLTTAAGDDILYVVDAGGGTPVSKQISLNDFYATVPANTTFTGTVTASSTVDVSNGIVTLSTPTTVSSNNATTQLGAGRQGSIFWDEDFLYVAVSNTVIKRVALSVFSP